MVKSLSSVQQHKGVGVVDQPGTTTVHKHLTDVTLIFTPSLIPAGTLPSCQEDIKLKSVKHRHMLLFPHFHRCLFFNSLLKKQPKAASRDQRWLKPTEDE